ncbi:MAG: ATP-binding cassette domain-containing protein [Gammaproteobacteria bacterium]|nr:ATP-binding cassette domain-containing protein [Gammaproteobacteria bacterium]
MTAYELHNIKVFRQQNCILDIPSLILPKSDCIALFGDNGAGKSTLLDLLAFIKTPSEGKVFLSGMPVTLPLLPAQRCKIGYVSQHPFLLSGTVSDNIRLALKLQNIETKRHPRLITEALEQVGLTHLVNQAASTLSGGELKRAAIARAISYHPEILLLDEPFSHLDQSHSQVLETIIAQLAHQTQTTVIFSTHNRLQGRALADDVINLVDGKTTKSPLINVYDGTLKQAIFDTGKLHIHTNSMQHKGRHIAIDPHEIIVSHQAIRSSMRNQFQGRIISIAEEANEVRVTVDCQERFHAIITHSSLQELKLELGQNIWISFKSQAVSVF